MKSERTIRREMARLDAVMRSAHTSMHGGLAAHEVLAALRWVLGEKPAMTPSRKIAVIYQAVEPQ